jgi:hypothetical protein
MNDRIKVNLISRSKLESLSTEEKISFIMDEVEKGKILVLEVGLTPEEQMKLIQSTMEEIKDEFIGIEMQGYERKKSWIKKIFGRNSKPRMIVIGPADKLKTIHKDNHMIQTMILSGKK